MNQNTRINMKKIEDPASVADFYADEQDNCYYEDGSKIFCVFHESQQMKHKEGWLYCVNCNIEEEAV